MKKYRFLMQLSDWLLLPTKTNKRDEKTNTKDSFCSRARTYKDIFSVNYATLIFEHSDWLKNIERPIRVVQMSSIILILYY